MKQRIITGGVTGIIFLSLLQVGGYAFAALIALMAAVGFFEWLRLHKMKAESLAGLAGFAGLVFVILPQFEALRPMALSWTAVIWLTAFALLSVTVLSNNRVTAREAAIVLLGVVYIGTGFYFMIETRLQSGLFWSYFLFVSIWLTDIGAYFSGYLFGKKLLRPKISPKKTLEGAAGGMAVSVAAAVVFSLAAPEKLDLLDAVWLGALISVVGQLGDLMQSAYKRAVNVKDSGSLFPGHGGILDRCDSWLIVFPFVHIVLDII